MSRIFDALQRSERERSGKATAEEGAARAAHWKTVVGEAQRAAMGEAKVACCEASNGHRPAAAWNREGQERFRVLHHRLEQLRRQRPLQKVLVTSAIPKEGKTTVAVNLAITLARSSDRVLLVDGDLRHADVHRVLGLPAQPGLADWLEERMGLQEALRRVEPYGFRLLAGGKAELNPAETLRLPKLQEFLAESSSQFEWVVVDSPPLVPFVDAQHLANLVDGTLLVLRTGVTTRSALVQAVGAIGRAFVAGMVVNGVTDSNDGYYNYYKTPKKSFTAGVDKSVGQPAAARVAGDEKRPRD
jgi:capsular exopolysaccharide synthesis family protein